MENQIAKDRTYCWCSYALLADERLNITDAIIFGILHDRCFDDTLQCRIKVETIMQLTRLSRRTVFYSLERLAECGYLTIQRTQTASTYILSTHVLPPKDFTRKQKKVKKHKPSSMQQQPDSEESLSGQLDFFSEPAPGRQPDSSSSSGVKMRWGKYRHVELTTEEYQELVQEFGENKVSEYIRKADEYCQQHGKSYEDYVVTIRKWILEDKETGETTYLDLFAQLSPEKQKKYQLIVERHKKELSKPVGKKIPFDDFEKYLGYLSLVR